MTAEAQARDPHSDIHSERVLCLRGSTPDQRQSAGQRCVAWRGFEFAHRDIRAGSLCGGFRL